MRKFGSFVRVGVTGEISILRCAAHVARCCALAAILTATGCSSRPSAVPPVKVNMDAVVSDLMAQHDTDKNGALSRSELAASPPLEDCFSRSHRNEKDEISADELKSTLRRVFDPGTAVVSATCAIRRNGQPLAGANVKFVPLPEFKDSLPAATGVTDANGFASLAAKPEELPSQAPKVALMTPGFYLVEVTHPTVQIPEKYNRQTVLGKEVSTETVYGGKLAIDLKL
jgi:hypothetical protein